jgi:hypothetical protein
MNADGKVVYLRHTGLLLQWILHKFRPAGTKGAVKADESVVYLRHTRPLKTTFLRMFHPSETFRFPNYKL